MNNLLTCTLDKITVFQGSFKPLSEDYSSLLHNKIKHTMIDDIML
jgi:hypothetical protein